MAKQYLSRNAHPRGVHYVNDLYTDHVNSDWHAVKNKERFYMPTDNTSATGNTTPDGIFSPPTEVPATPVEIPTTPTPLIGGKTDLKGFARVANVTVEGNDLTVIATGDPQSVWAYRSDGMTCGHCSAVTTDTDLTFCPSCGVGYVIRAFVGIAP